MSVDKWVVKYWIYAYRIPRHHNCIAAINAELPDKVCDIAEHQVTGFTSGRIKESPLYRLSSSFHTISASKCFPLDLLQVLNASYDLVELVLKNSDSYRGAEPYLTYLSSIRGQIMSFTSINERNSPSKGDYVYECSRLASVIMLSCVESSQPLSKCPQSLIDMLVDALKRTEVGDNWGDLSGLMYWVVLVGAAVTQGRNEPGYMDSVLTQIMLHMCFSGYSLDSALEPPRKFGRFHYIITEWSKGSECRQNCP